MLVGSLQTSPPTGIVTLSAPPKVSTRSVPATIAGPPALRASDVWSMTTGPTPNWFCSRIRTASPPWLRRVTIRIDWFAKFLVETRCWDWAQLVNQPAASGAGASVADAVPRPVRRSPTVVRAASSVRSLRRRGRAVRVAGV